MKLKTKLRVSSAIGALSSILAILLLARLASPPPMWGCELTPREQAIIQGDRLARQ